MDGFRIRRDGTETTVADVTGLIRIAKAGELGEADEVRTATGWVRVADVAELRALVRKDPWSAWEGADEVDAAALYRRMVEVVGIAEELPAEALAPVRAPAPRAPRPPPDPPPMEPFEDERGEVVDFPEPPRPRALAPAPRPARPRPGAAQPVVRVGRIGAWVVAGMLLLGAAYAWMSVTGDTRTGVQAPPPAARSLPPASPVADAMIQLEAELRGRLAPTPRSVKEAGDLNDALMVELTQVGVSVEAVDAPVTKWVGRRLDEPKSAEVRITFVPTGDIARDLGGIALVVGRYKRTYHLDLSVIQVKDRTSGGTITLSEADVESFYLGRTPLGKFLASIPKS